MEMKNEKVSRNNVEETAPSSSELIGAIFTSTSIEPMFKEIEKVSINMESNSLYNPEDINNKIPRIHGTEDFEKYSPYINNRIFETPGILYTTAQVENLTNYVGQMMYYPNSINFYIAKYTPITRFNFAFSNYTIPNRLEYGTTADGGYDQMVAVWRHIRDRYANDAIPTREECTSTNHGTWFENNATPPVLRIKITKMCTKSDYFSETALANLFKNINLLNQFPDDLTKMMKFTDTSVSSQYTSRVIQYIMTRNGQSPRKLNFTSCFLKALLLIDQKCLNMSTVYEYNSHTNRPLALRFNQNHLVQRNPEMENYIEFAWCTFDQYYGYCNNDEIPEAPYHTRKWFFIPVTLNEIKNQWYVFFELVHFLPYPWCAHWTLVNSYFIETLALQAGQNNVIQRVGRMIMNLSNNIFIEGYHNICFVVMDENVPGVPDVNGYPDIPINYMVDGQMQDHQLANLFTGLPQGAAAPNLLHFLGHMINQDNIAFYKKYFEFLTYKDLHIPIGLYEFYIYITTTYSQIHSNTNNQVSYITRWPFLTNMMQFSNLESKQDYIGMMETPDTQQLFYRFIGVLKENRYDVYSNTMSFEQFENLHRYTMYKCGFIGSKITRENPIPLRMMFNATSFFTKGHQQIQSAIDGKYFNFNYNIIETGKNYLLFQTYRGPNNRYSNTNEDETICIYCDHIDWAENLSSNDEYNFTTIRRINWKKLKDNGLTTFTNQNDSVIMTHNDGKRKRIQMDVISEYMKNYFPAVHTLRVQAQAINVHHDVKHFYYPIYVITPFSSINVANESFAVPVFYPYLHFARPTLNKFMVNTTMVDATIWGFSIGIQETSFTFPRIMFINQPKDKLINDMPQEEINFDFEI